jgi:hypothetical protein
VREDIPTGISSRGRAEIEAFAAGLFETDADVRLVVTDGFVSETWAVVEWTFTGTREETGGGMTFRGASVLDLENGQIRHETDYYDLPQMQQQIAAAGGTPGALETPTAGTAATPGATSSGTDRLRHDSDLQLPSGAEPDRWTGAARPGHAPCRVHTP